MTAPAPQAYVQGQGAASADGLNTFEQVLTNFAMAATFIGLPGMQIFVQGFVEPGDGGQGPFYWNPLSAGPSDGVSVIVPQGVAQGAWVRIGPASAYSLQILLTGFAITVANNITQLILQPAGTLATGQVTFPAVPLDGQILGIASSQTITALTLTANIGQTLLGAVTTLAANTGVRYQYVASIKTWFRV
jgi:hypothetical protein